MPATRCGRFAIDVIPALRERRPHPVPTVEETSLGNSSTRCERIRAPTPMRRRPREARSAFERSHRPPSCPRRPSENGRTIQRPKCDQRAPTRCELAAREGDQRCTLHNGRAVFRPRDKAHPRVYRSVPALLYHPARERSSVCARPTYRPLSELTLADLESIRLVLSRGGSGHRLWPPRPLAFRTEQDVNEFAARRRKVRISPTPHRAAPAASAAHSEAAKVQLLLCPANFDFPKSQAVSDGEGLPPSEMLVAEWPPGIASSWRLHYLEGDAHPSIHLEAPP